MASRAGATSRRVASAAKTQGRKVLGPKAVSRLEKSLDAADVALKDLRKELGRGGRDTIKDFEKTLSDSRKNLRSLARTLSRDAEKLQKAATKGQAPKTTARRQSSSSRSRSTSASRGSGSGSGSRSTAARSGSRSTASRAKGGAKRATTRRSPTKK